MQRSRLSEHETTPPCWRLELLNWKKEWVKMWKSGNSYAI